MISAPLARDAEPRRRQWLDVMTADDLSDLAFPK